jgi:hypothetical protein
MSQTTKFDQWMVELLKNPSLSEGLLSDKSGEVDGLLNSLLQGFPEFASGVLRGESVESLDELDEMIAALGIEAPTEVEEGVVDHLLGQQSVGTLLSVLTDKLEEMQILVLEVSNRNLSPEEQFKLQDVEVCLGNLILSVGSLRIEAGVETSTRSTRQRIWIDRIKAILFYKIF